MRTSDVAYTIKLPSVRAAFCGVVQALDWLKTVIVQWPSTAVSYKGCRAPLSVA